MHFFLSQKDKVKDQVSGDMKTVPPLCQSSALPVFHLTASNGSAMNSLRPSP